MKKILIWLALLVAGGLMLSAVIGWWMRKADPRGVVRRVDDRGLERYDFDSLRKRKGVAGRFEILGEIEAVNTRRKRGYEFETRQIRFESNGKWVTGMMNYYPEKSSLSKVIIMIRGYAEKEGYYSGSGSWRVADELAESGYTTISLDFLGYGDSDQESTDVLEARFEKVVTLLDLMETVKNLPWVDKGKIGIWAHSNGGQIVLSTLEASGANYPTVLWAPMTQKFPESVLSTIDEGSPVRLEIETFMRFYDARRYAFENYLEWVNSPILILQGTEDEWCRVEWQEELVAKLVSFGKVAKLEVYPGADHNLAGPPASGWEKGVKSSKEWYNVWLIF